LKLVGEFNHHIATLPMIELTVNFSFAKPLPLQRLALAPILEGKNDIAEAVSFSGRSTLLAISVLQCLDPSIPTNNCQALVISGSREHIQRFEKAIVLLGAHMDINYHGFMGGTATREEFGLLRSDRGCQIFNATPGRIYDMIIRQVLNLDHLKMICLDEVHEMQWRDLILPLEEIFDEEKGMLPKDVQVVATSLGTNNEAEFLGKLRIMEDAVRIPRVMERK
jgi:ATP-dependent RNA helicase RhlE